VTKGRRDLTTPAVQAVRRRWQEFEATMRKSLEYAIALGKELVALKEAVPHGQFGRYFQDSKDPVQDPLPFNRQWAFKLMTAAESDLLANVSHAKHLPADLETVYQLATLPQPALEAAIEAGRITPDLTRAEAKALKREISPKAIVEKPQPLQEEVWAACERTITDAVDDAVRLFPQLDWRIKNLLDHISNTLNNAIKQRRKLQDRDSAIDQHDQRRGQF
jgi:hypothetical protein